jgi:tetratricopeptide (TPR) repeat protein
VPADVESALPVDPDVTGEELGGEVLSELSSLSPRTRERVATHLVMAGRLLDEDPDLARQHVRAASQGAMRLAVVREALGVAAYACEDFEDAAKQLRTARRISGSDAYLAMIADCERAAGRPEQALELAKSVSQAGRGTTTADVVELRIVAAGALRDMGRLDEAIDLLDTSHLHTGSTAAWSPRLRYAYADALQANGDLAGARTWFARAADVDQDGETDAEVRLVELFDGGAPGP